MKKCAYVVNEHEPHLSLLEKKFSFLEGKVVFSERESKNHSEVLILKLENIESRIIVHGEHRIDVGEIVRIHCNSGVDGPDRNRFCEAYEILSSDGEVKNRYKSNSEYKFVED
jgi:hypothetical protein